MADTSTLKRKDIEFVRGDTFKFNVGFKDISDEPSELTFTIKANENDEPIVTANIANGRVTAYTGENDYDYTVRVAPSDTSGITSLLRMYKYDLEVTVGSDVYTILYGNCRILPDYTRP